MKTASEIEALIAQYYDHKTGNYKWSLQLITIYVKERKVIPAPLLLTDPKLLLFIQRTI